MSADDELWADAVAVAAALAYDPGCPVCTEERGGEHPNDCAMRAARRILGLDELAGDVRPVFTRAVGERPLPCGLYADELDKLSTYNAERARGLVHAPSYADVMAELQARVDAAAVAELLPERRP